VADRSRLASRPAPGQLRYDRYASPVGELRIIGDDLSLKELAFRGSASGLPRDVAKGNNRSIVSCRAYLDYYFEEAGRGKKNTLLNQTVRLDAKSQMVRVSAGRISLDIDCSSFTINEATVYATLLTIPFGSTISYGELARRSGLGGAARFVGTTMAKNMVPIIIPCHRVIRSDGSLGNYSGGTHIKKFLLELECS
jgi:O-6-methylguanine DNA methyltransferase